MRRTKYQKMILLIFSLLILSSLSAYGNVSVSEAEKLFALYPPFSSAENPQSYPKDSRERYVAGLALKENISYKEAERKESLQRSSLGLSADQKFLYKSIGKQVSASSAFKGPAIHIGAEVRYIASSTEQTFQKIDSVGGAYMYFPDSALLSFDGGDFNIESTDAEARISRTGFCIREIGLSLPVSFRKNGLRLNLGSGFKFYPAKSPKTFIIYIGKSDFSASP